MSKTNGKRNKHQHAFCLITYRNGNRGKVIWNSRDGAVPESFNSEGVEWYLYDSVYAPNHQPKIGEGVIIDISEEQALEIAKVIVEDFWNREPDPLSNFYPNKIAAARALAEDKARNPYLEIVTQEWLDAQNNSKISDSRH